jgi:hypothetical protein
VRAWIPALKHKTSFLYKENFNSDKKTGGKFANLCSFGSPGA